MSKDWGRHLLFFKKHRAKIIGLFALILGAASLFYFFPLEWLELRSRWELRQAGISEVDFQVTTPPMHGYERIQCKSTETCSCIVFIHGLGDTALTWKRILETRKEVLEKMGMGRPFRFLALDLPGSGKTGVPPESSGYRVRNQAKQIVQILKSLKGAEPSCSQWIVVGNSLGGWIAVWAALEWPEGVKRLLLLSPAGLKPLQSEVHLLTEPTVETLKEFQKRAYFKPRPIPENVWVEIVKRAKSGHSREITAAQVTEDYLQNQLNALRTTTTTIMLWGKEDRVIPITVGYEMRDLLRSTLWREVPECGHMPQKECPLPVIQSIIDLMNFGAM